MIIHPMVRNNICMNAHPKGCEQYVQQAADFVQSKPSFKGPARVLVIGSSTGYGLSSRIALSVRGGSRTLGVLFERPPSEKRTASAGWYSDRAYRDFIEKDSHSINADAFSHETKSEVAEYIKKNFGQIDCVVYSLASALRIDPDTGQQYRSVIKPIGQDYETKSIDINGKFLNTMVAAASSKEIAETVKVMGGEDWELWIKKLMEEDLLASGCLTLSYSYIGPPQTRAIYHDGTIGKAKEDLEKAASRLRNLLKPLSGSAYVSVNKALVTRASSVIPGVLLYLSVLYKIMKDKGIHEGCCAQMHRLFSEKLYGTTSIPYDEKNRIRMDDWEMRKDVQEDVARIWNSVSNDNIAEQGDIEGIRNEFFHIHGFNFSTINYDADVELS